jgi:hypothetical protein
MWFWGAFLDREVLFVLESLRIQQILIVSLVHNIFSLPC